LNNQYPHIIIKQLLLRKAGIALICFILAICVTSTVYAQPFAETKISDTVSFKHEPQSGEYDEILITLNVPRIGSIEISAVIYEETAYLPVRELFDFLKIKNTASADLKSVDGFFIDPKATYRIDKTSSQIIYNNKTWSLAPGDIVITETGLYLRSGLFGPVFGLNCQFNFRNLAINLSTNIDCFKGNETGKHAQKSQPA
jgi:hypothetical protein